MKQFKEMKQFKVDDIVKVIKTPLCLKHYLNMHGTIKFINKRGILVGLFCGSSFYFDNDELSMVCDIYPEYLKR